ncbi:MAG: F0F1 ATP synthase subunit B [Pirellulaceae bacterium]|nr:F0F1 ATP synthase subunit B [Pirellulaceae bacterium]
MRGTGFLLWLISRVAVAALLWGATFTCAYAQEEKAKSAEVEKAHPETPGGSEAESHAKEHHGDPTDLTHANPSRAIANPDELKGDAAIATFVIFLLLMAILTKFAWTPIAHGLEAREKGILDKIEQARLAAEKATAQLHEYEARLAAATQEAQQIVGEARKTAETAKEKILSEAQALAQREREKAVADITVAKNQALREIAEKSVDTAIGLARNIIRREVRPGDHDQLIQDALKQFPNN